MASTRKSSELQGDLLPKLVTAHNALTASLGAAGILPHHDTTTLVTASDASDLATSVTLANALRTAYIAHIASTAAHVAADATNTIAAAVATDLASVQTLLNELKTDFTAHIALQSAHRSYVSGQGNATVAGVTTANASDQGTANTLANALKNACNRHFSMGVPDIQITAS